MFLKSNIVSRLNFKRKKSFTLKKAKEFIILLLICFSAYSYLLAREAKKESERLSESVKKINKELTPKPTPILTPTPTAKPVFSDYIFISMPHSGVVYSCKRTSESIVKEASTNANAKTPTEDMKKCISEKDCSQECGSKNFDCRRNCDEANIKKCVGNQMDANKKLIDAYKKLTEVIQENCTVKK